MHDYWNQVRKQLFAYSGFIIAYSVFYACSVYFNVREAEVVYTHDFIPISVIFIFGGAAFNYYTAKEKSQ